MYSSKFNTSSEDEDMLFSTELTSSKSNIAPKRGPISFKFGGFEKNSKQSLGGTLFDEDGNDELVL